MKNFDADESQKLAHTIETVRASAGTYIDTWPDRMNPESLRRKAEACRKRTSSAPKAAESNEPESIEEPAQEVA